MGLGEAVGARRLGLALALALTPGACGGAPGTVVDAGDAGLTPDGGDTSERIGFDELVSDAVVWAQYGPDVVFRTTKGRRLYARAEAAASSPPNALCAGTTECIADVYVVFGAPVQALSLVAVGVEGSGPVARIRAYSGNTQLLDEPLVADGRAAIPIDLSAIVGVTRLELREIVDPGGIAWDDLRFSRWP